LFNNNKKQGFTTVHLTLLSKKSFASLIFAAIYGEPPRLEMKNSKFGIKNIEFTSIRMIENN
jgi:hypothetical protein